MASKFRSHVAAHEAGTLHRSLPCVHCDKTFKKQYDLARYLWRRKWVTSYVYIFISDTSSPTLASSPTLVLSVVRALWMEQGWSNTDGFTYNTEPTGSTLFRQSSWYSLSFVTLTTLNFRCPVQGCKEAFRHKGHLKSHTASFHPEVFSCRLYITCCTLHAQSFWSSNNLYWILGSRRARRTEVRLPPLQQKVAHNNYKPNIPIF